MDIPMDAEVYCSDRSKLCAIRPGSRFNSIIGRNSFQRDRSAALGLLEHMVRIHKAEML
jgi:hypothetical protein